MNLNQASTELTQAMTKYPHVPRFELVDESIWQTGSISHPDTEHRRIEANEGGVVCLDCHKVVALDSVISKTDSNDILVWAKTIADYWGNRKAIIRPK